MARRAGFHDCVTIKPNTDSGNEFGKPTNMAVTSLRERHSATEPTPAIDARAQADRILQSRIFRASEVLRHLFGYLTEKSLDGTADTLKEYTIGLDALGKPASFDPRQESVV